MTTDEPKSPDTITNRELDVWLHKRLNDSPWGAGLPPCRSTNMLWAWDVVEKMRERGYCWGITECLPSGAKDTVWQVRCAKWKDEIGDWHTQVDNSAPRAICLAAKAALESET